MTGQTLYAKKREAAIPRTRLEHTVQFQPANGTRLAEVHDSGPDEPYTVPIGISFEFLYDDETMIVASATATNQGVPGASTPTTHMLLSTAQLPTEVRPKDQIVLMAQYKTISGQTTTGQMLLFPDGNIRIYNGLNLSLISVFDLPIIFYPVTGCFVK